MSFDFRSFMPNRISGQIAMIVVVSLVIIHIVLATLFFLSRSDHLPDRPLEQLVTLVRLIDATPAGARSRLMSDVNAAFPHLDMMLTTSLPKADNQQIDDRLTNRIRHSLSHDFQVTRIAQPASADTLPRIAVQMRDGEVISARIAPPSTTTPFRGPFMVTLLFVAISVTILGLWTARVLTKPLRSFAEAAESFQPEGELAPLPERGPDEIRVAARALNRMRERIKELVESRTLMLAAVSHDLRTPITRLRLRSELINDETLRMQTLDDLAHMSSMIASVLVYLRGGKIREPATMIDIATSVQTICDQFADVGHDIRYGGPDHVVLRGHPEELRRAVTNLIDNAARYGSKIEVRLIEGPSSISIEVQDDGPGILDIHKEAMQQPFVRGDAARGMNAKNGFGLGLSITRAVVEAHGGTLELLDGVPTGLTARITLPPCLDHK
jgi:signal transduction histidine kinase